MMRSVTKRIQGLMTKPTFNFSGGFAGPYNPYLYKDYLVPKSFPTNKQLYNSVRYHDKIVNPPVRNMRHINPIRQSGPLPPYFGTYTMEDIKKQYDVCYLPADIDYIQVDVDEIMRRVPGITRKEATYISQLGLSPYQQIAYAYQAYHLGIDIFYTPNVIYAARQVVTNSKGQKVQIFFNSMCFEDMSQLNVGFAPILETVDYHWEIFLWADVPIKVTGDLDLGVANTWFEYELEWSTEMSIAQDQMNLPEDIRPFDTGRNPHSRRELWKSQQRIQAEKEMLDPNWKLPTL